MKNSLTLCSSSITNQLRHILISDFQPKVMITKIREILSSLANKRHLWYIYVYNLFLTGTYLKQFDYFTLLKHAQCVSDVAWLRTKSSINLANQANLSSWLKHRFYLNSCWYGTDFCQTHWWYLVRVLFDRYLPTWIDKHCQR